MKELKGLPVSPGIAIGKVYIYHPFSCEVPEAHFPPEDARHYYEMYQLALRTAAEELDAMIAHLEALGNDKSLIFEAHKEILEDEELLEETAAAILDETCMPDYAVASTFERFAGILENAADPLIAARAADLYDVKNRLVRILHGEKERNLSMLHENVIVVAQDLLPSDTATMDKEHVLAIVTQTGSATSHSAIIANSYAIPAVLGVADVTSILYDGAAAAVDALEGRVYLEPDAPTLAHLEQKQAQYRAQASELLKFRSVPCVLRSGEPLQIGLNIGSADYQDAYAYVDFVGLMRSEFLYMQAQSMPSEQTQYNAYVRVLRHANGKPVTLRTLDIGGDKTLPYLQLPHEENPFLGNRALRFCLEHSELFRTQLRAALRASAEGPLQLMFPMVGSMDDIYAAKAAVRQVQQELLAKGIAFDAQIKLGIMIEIPAIAEIADLAAREVDFASVGSNDLVQYLCASDRMNPAVTPYYQSFSPAVFRVLARVISAFRAAGKPVSVCGELAGNPLAAPILAGLGLEKFSMSAASIAPVKKALMQFSLEELHTLANAAIGASTQKAVMELAEAALHGKE